MPAVSALGASSAGNGVLRVVRILVRDVPDGASAFSPVPGARRAMSRRRFYLRRFHPLNFQSASVQALRHLNRADTTMPPGELISSPPNIQKPRVAHSLLPQADAKAACGRGVIPRRPRRQTLRHLATTEHEPPAVTTYSASAGLRRSARISSDRFASSYECAPTSESRVPI